VVLDAERNRNIHVVSLTRSRRYSYGDPRTRHGKSDLDRESSEQKPRTHVALGRSQPESRGVMSAILNWFKAEMKA
jgi:hypothetical protein